MQALLLLLQLGLDKIEKITLVWLVIHYQKVRNNLYFSCKLFFDEQQALFRNNRNLRIFLGIHFFWDFEYSKTTKQNEQLHENFKHACNEAFSLGTFEVRPKFFFRFIHQPTFACKKFLRLRRLEYRTTQSPYFRATTYQKLHFYQI